MVVAGTLQLDGHIDLPDNSRVRVAVEPLEPARGSLRSDPEARFAALQNLAASDEPKAAEFLVDQLCDDSLPPAWRNQLVLFAEGIQISDRSLRHRLKQRLLTLADSLRESAESGIRPVVCSAIRTYASVISPSEVDTLTRFLEPRPVETRLVALQSIIHFYEAHPPQNASVPGTLADRIDELAQKFLDRDWLIAGEKAAIGQNAAHALAAIGDARVAECVERVLSLRMRWVIRQLAGKLESTLRMWQLKGVDTSDPPAQRVCEQLRRLVQAPVDNPS